MALPAPCPGPLAGGPCLGSGWIDQPPRGRRLRCTICSPKRWGLTGQLGEQRRARLAGQADSTSQPAPQPTAPGELERAYRAELAELGELESARGVMILGLARAMDRGPSDSALAPLAGRLMAESAKLRAGAAGSRRDIERQRRRRSSHWRPTTR